MRLELTTSAVTGRRSNQLSHEAIMNLDYLIQNTRTICFEMLCSFCKSYALTWHKSFGLAQWLSSRPISNHQLNALLHLHLGPIYLVVFKGS